MSRATVPMLPVSECSQAVSPLAQTRSATCYHRLVEQGFLQQEELVLATAEAARKRSVPHWQNSMTARFSPMTSARSWSGSY